MYLLEFNEIQKEVIWGGTLLASVYSKPFDKSKAIGESWEICDLPNDNSVVSNGELKGKTLSYLVKEYGSELLGTKCKEDYFPLLIKLIDAKDKLSIFITLPLIISAGFLGVGRPPNCSGHIGIRL